VAGLKCPQCGIGDVGEKRTRRGKPFWGCTRYPECDWSSWDEPVARPCPNCDAPFLVRKTTKARGEFMRCQQCYHEYTLGADDSLDPAGVGVPTPAERRARKDNGGDDPAAAGHSYRRGMKKSFARKSAAQKSGSKKSAAKTSGAKTSGAKTSGAKTSGAKRSKE
jgi:hypothetical protein